MLKKLVLLLTGFIIIGVQGNAQTMKEVFLAMPNSVLPLLSKDNRADFIDFLASKMKARVKNAYNENSYMDTLTTDYTHIRLTAVSDVTLKLLPLTDSTKVICMVHTYHSDAGDSKISFFDTKWHSLDSNNFLTVPEVNDFLISGNEDTLQLAKSKLDVPMIVASFSPASSDLKFVYDTAYLSQEDKKAVKACIRPEIVKKWVNGKFISK